MGYKKDDEKYIVHSISGAIYYIKNKEISLVINTPLGAQSRYDEEAIGKACIQKGIMAITTISAADSVLHSIITKNKIQVKSLQEYHN